LDADAVKASTVTSSYGGSTCYLGSRQSQFYGRLYDKGAQEGMEPGWLWRYEVECKKPAAESVVNRLLETEAVSDWVSSYVAQFFDLRGVSPLWHASNIEHAIEIEAKVTSNEQSLQWLRTQVRPTVGRLCVAGLEAEVREALGLPAQQLDFASLGGLT
jgi:DNA relaxase NicK